MLDLGPLEVFISKRRAVRASAPSPLTLGFPIRDCMGEGMIVQYPSVFTMRIFICKDRNFPLYKMPCNFLIAMNQIIVYHYTQPFTLEWEGDKMICSNIPAACLSPGRDDTCIFKICFVLFLPNRDDGSDSIYFP